MKRPPVRPLDRPHADDLDEWGVNPFPSDAGLMFHGVLELLREYPEEAPSALKQVLLRAEYEQQHNPAISPLDVLAVRPVRKQWPNPVKKEYVILEAIDLVRELPNQLGMMRLALLRFGDIHPGRTTGQVGEVRR